MSLKDDKQQNIQLRLDFSSALTGAARGVAGEETESSVATSGPESPARTNRLMEEVCERENLKEARPTNQTCRQRIGGRQCRLSATQVLATSVQGESLGCDLLAQEVLGFGFFVVPLLQLVGTKEADDPLTNRVAICNNLADYVGFGRIGILLHVLCDLFSCFRKSDAKLFLLIVGEVQVASETPQ